MIYNTYLPNKHIIDFLSKAQTESYNQITDNCDYIVGEWVLMDLGTRLHPISIYAITSFYYNVADPPNWKHIRGILGFRKYI